MQCVDFEFFCGFSVFWSGSSRNGNPKCAGAEITLRCCHIVALVEFLSSYDVKIVCARKSRSQLSGCLRTLRLLFDVDF